MWDGKSASESISLHFILFPNYSLRNIKRNCRAKSFDGKFDFHVTMWLSFLFIFFTCVCTSVNCSSAVCVVTEGTSIYSDIKAKANTHSVNTLYYTANKYVGVVGVIKK